MSYGYIILSKVVPCSLYSYFSSRVDMWQDKVQENLQLFSWWFSRGISVEEKSEGKRKLGGLVEPGMDGEVEGLISTALVAQPLRHVPVGEQRGAAQHHPGCFAHYKITYCVGTSEQPCSVTWGRHSSLLCRGSFFPWDSHSYSTTEARRLPFSNRMNIS